MKQQDSDAKDHCITGMMTPIEYKRFVQKLVCCHQEESQKGNEDSIAGVLSLLCHKEVLARPLVTYVFILVSMWLQETECMKCMRISTSRSKLLIVLVNKYHLPLS